MGKSLDDHAVKKLETPASGNRITYDSSVRGFGVRVTQSGARAFVLNYRHGGRERRITIGNYPGWSFEAAKRRAKELRREVDSGGDPMGDRHTARAVPTMNELADIFAEKHLPKLRPATGADYRTILDKYVRPKLGKIKATELTTAAIEELHASLARTHPYQANRMLALVAKMMERAEFWKLRPQNSNPAKGIEKAREYERDRYLSAEDICRVGDALAELKEQGSADALRLLLLTGARKAEVLKARWPEFDLKEGVWLKPPPPTRNKGANRVPLSDAALKLVTAMKARADEKARLNEESGSDGPSSFLFPGRRGGGLGDIKRSWATVCLKAGLGSFVEGKDAAGKPTRTWEADTRVHDLRHTFASIAVSGGSTLPVLMRLLGHRQIGTTLRYAHVMDDPLRAAVNQVGTATVAVDGGNRPRPGGR